MDHFDFNAKNELINLIDNYKERIYQQKVLIRSCKHSIKRYKEEIKNCKKDIKLLS